MSEKTKKQGKKGPGLYYRLLIYGLLWIIAAVKLYNAYEILSGLQYEDQGLDAASVYEYYEGLKACDIFYGLAVFFTGVYYIAVRFALKRKTKEAHLLLYLGQAMSMAFAVVYSLFVMGSCGIGIFAQVILSLIPTLIFMLINIIYFTFRPLSSN